MRTRKRIVLYYPRQTTQGPPYTTGPQDLPLPLLTIAAWPLADGFEVVLIDGTRMEPAESERRVLEACDGALLYATTGILGPQITDADACTRAVAKAYPDLPRFLGGWFASVRPEVQLATGLYDAVAIGQGELTFRELVQAVADGASIEDIDGLAFLRDGEVVRSKPRGVVGWDRLLDCPWELLEFEQYRAPQLVRGQVMNGYPMRHMPRVEISYYSSFGYPIQCTFCCSPGVSGLRWKAMPAGRMLDDLEKLREHWDFDGLHFYDANFGVSEKRVREFCEGLLARGIKVEWYAYLQAQSIMNYDPGTLDLMQQSGLYACVIGAEAGSDDMMARIKKPTRGDDNIEAALEMTRRGVSPLMSYIIGYPDEGEESMLATIEQARRVTLACPDAYAMVWPFRPLPGTEDFSSAVAAGYRSPETIEEWGHAGDYWHESGWPGRIPAHVEEARRMYMHYASLAQGRVRKMHGFWERRALRRLERGDFVRGRLEARLFNLVNKLSPTKLSSRLPVPVS